MKIISTPTRDTPPKPPSWWRSIGKRTGTVVEHDGAQWMLGHHASDWFGTDGRMWLPVQAEGKRAPMSHRQAEELARKAFPFDGSKADTVLEARRRMYLALTDQVGGEGQ